MTKFSVCSFTIKRPYCTRLSSTTPCRRVSRPHTGWWVYSHGEKPTTGCHRERRWNRMEMRPETIHLKCVPRRFIWNASRECKPETRNEKQLCKEYIHIFSTSVRYLPAQVDPIGLYILIHKKVCCGLKEVQFLLLISGRTHIFKLEHWYIDEEGSIKKRIQSRTTITIYLFTTLTLGLKAEQDTKADGFLLNLEVIKDW